MSGLTTLREQILVLLSGYDVSRHLNRITYNLLSADTASKIDVVLSILKKPSNFKDPGTSCISAVAETDNEEIEAREFQLTLGLSCMGRKTWGT